MQAQFIGRGLKPFPRTGRAPDACPTLSHEPLGRATVRTDVDVGYGWIADLATAARVIGSENGELTWTGIGCGVGDRLIGLVQVELGDFELCEID